MRLCTALGVAVIAEGIETHGELEALRAPGVRYIQGYLFAKPDFERLPAVDIEVAAMIREGAVKANAPGCRFRIKMTSAAGSSSEFSS